MRKTMILEVNTRKPKHIKDMLLKSAKPIHWHKVFGFKSRRFDYIEPSEFQYAKNQRKRKKRRHKKKIDTRIARYNNCLSVIKRIAVISIIGKIANLIWIF